jgi:putative membrane protein
VQAAESITPLPKRIPILPDSKFERWLFAIFIVVWAVSCISVPYPKYFALQHVPTVAAVVALVAVDRRWPLGRLSFTLIIIFLLLHVLGARYLYSFVPYDDWSEALIGVRITDYFGFERNHYDRLVHFAFGVLFVPPLWQAFVTRLGVRAFWSAVFAISGVLAASAVYEIIEWGMAMFFAPDWAESYNGQQGDVWDAQRDMALAGAGAILAALIVGATRKNIGES